jgi:hypothetical protein
VKLNIKVDSAYSRLHKVQRLVPSPRHDGFLVITHAITPDVIFGTQFSVTDIWRLEDVPGQRQCRLRISLGGLFLNAGWAVTMLIPIIRGRIVSEGQEMWQHWAEVAKLRVSRLAHELLSGPSQGAGSGAEAASDGEDSAAETEYTEDERHAATGGLASVGGVSGMVFDEGVVKEELQQTLDALRRIELSVEEVAGEERLLQEQIIRQQVLDQQRQMAERKAEKERLHAKLVAQKQLLQEQEEARARQAAAPGGETAEEPTPSSGDATAPAAGSPGAGDTRTHIVFNLSAAELASDSESSTESDTDAEEVARMTLEERTKHDKRVRRRAKAHRRKHQRRLLREAKRSAQEPLPSSGQPGAALPSAVAAGLSGGDAGGKMHLSLAEIAAREARVADELALQNQRMCTRECAPANPCAIM